MTGRYEAKQDSAWAHYPMVIAVVLGVAAALLVPERWGVPLAIYIVVVAVLSYVAGYAERRARHP